jgi:hypothetical protein
MAHTKCDPLLTLCPGFAKHPGPKPSASETAAWDCMKTCVIAHEQVHHHQCKNQGPERGDGQCNNPVQIACNEPPAYQAGIDCLEALLT